MTRQEIKEKHPAIYAEIAKEAVTAEQERVKSWLAFAEIDAEKVTAAIKDGSEVTPSVISEMSIKAASKAQITNIQAASAPGVKTTPAPTVATTPEAEAHQKELEEFEAKCTAATRNSLGITKENK